MSHRIRIMGTRTHREEGQNEKMQLLQTLLGLAGTIALPANSDTRGQQQIEPH